MSNGPLSKDRVYAEICSHIRHCLQREIAEPAPSGRAVCRLRWNFRWRTCNKLAVYDNVVENCGLSPREPVCGIFELQVAGCDLHRNRVLENGATPSREIGNINFKVGHRGGIVIAFALAPAITQAKNTANLLAAEAVAASVPLHTGEGREPY